MCLLLPKKVRTIPNPHNDQKPALLSESPALGGACVLVRERNRVGFLAVVLPCNRLGNVWPAIQQVKSDEGLRNRLATMPAVVSMPLALAGFDGDELKIQVVAEEFVHVCVSLVDRGY